MRGCISGWKLSSNLSTNKCDKQPRLTIAFPLTIMGHPLVYFSWAAHWFFFHTVGAMIGWVGVTKKENRGTQQLAKNRVSLPSKTATPTCSVWRRSGEWTWKNKSTHHFRVKKRRSECCKKWFCMWFCCCSFYCCVPGTGTLITTSVTVIVDNYKWTGQMGICVEQGRRDLGNVTEVAVAAEKSFFCGSVWCTSVLLDWHCVSHTTCIWCKSQWHSHPPPTLLCCWFCCAIGNLGRLRKWMELMCALYTCEYKWRWRTYGSSWRAWRTM